ncbi:helix-turn-helix domain-containing protein [Ignatzschineria indica]|uniref:helix-turn-helix transcriptional regulator n=1 Tax=Ignatzschineria indica TaxID=472583 RepID=UPI002575CC71|nr:helix-turn-helix domain-containing protein [Ignatzschineria indica]MDM1545548.1 helix-turn-helix domain-containing protein [Ignatzschineria indica]
MYEKLYEKFGSQEAIAEAIGVTQKTVHTWSRGSYPSSTNARKIAEVLGCTIGEVYDQLGGNIKRKADE